MIVDLEKAMDRTKLIKVGVQVNGKHGTYSSHRWKKPLEAMKILKEDLKGALNSNVEDFTFTNKQTGKQETEKEIVNNYQKENTGETMQNYVKKRYKVSPGKKSGTSKAKTEGKQPKNVVSYEDLQFVHSDEANGWFELQFGNGEDALFIKVDMKDHPDGITDEFYFDDEELVNKIIEENTDQLEEQIEEKNDAEVNDTDNDSSDSPVSYKDLQFVYGDKDNGWYELQFGNGEDALFIKVNMKDHPGGITDEDYFDDEELVNKIIEENQNQLEEQIEEKNNKINKAINTIYKADTLDEQGRFKKLMKLNKIRVKF